jgi:hypothetical protein
MSTTNLSRYRADLSKLLELGDLMEEDIFLKELSKTRDLTEEEKKRAEKNKGAFRREYQKWYTEALAVIRQITPERREEFEHLYRGDGKRRSIDITNYTIQDWLAGLTFTSSNVDGYAAAAMRFSVQLEILKAAEKRFESTLFDIRQILQAELFDSELDTAKELLKGGFFRGAGAIAGVVLEKHLAQVASNHAITIRKKHPSISDLNDALKNAGVIDLTVWRGIQRLGDLRNLCDHSKEREPTSQDVGELIEGVDKCTKTLF